MTKITGYFCIVCNVKKMGPLQSDHNKQLIALTLITLSGFNSKTLIWLGFRLRFQFSLHSRPILFCGSSISSVLDSSRRSLMTNPELLKASGNPSWAQLVLRIIWTKFHRCCGIFPCFSQSGTLKSYLTLEFLGSQPLSLWDNW